MALDNTEEKINEFHQLMSLEIEHLLSNSTMTRDLSAKIYKLDRFFHNLAPVMLDKYITGIVLNANKCIKVLSTSNLSDGQKLLLKQLFMNLNSRYRKNYEDIQNEILNVPPLESIQFRTNSTSSERVCKEALSYLYPQDLKQLEGLIQEADLLREKNTVQRLSSDQKPVVHITDYETYREECVGLTSKTWELIKKMQKKVEFCHMPGTSKARLVGVKKELNTWVSSIESMQEQDTQLSGYASQASLFIASQLETDDTAPINLLIADGTLLIEKIKIRFKSIELQKLIEKCQASEYQDDATLKQYISEASVTIETTSAKEVLTALDAHITKIGQFMATKQQASLPAPQSTVAAPPSMMTPPLSSPPAAAPKATFNLKLFAGLSAGALVVGILALGVMGVLSAPLFIPATPLFIPSISAAVVAGLGALGLFVVSPFIHAGQKNGSADFVKYLHVP